MDENIVELLKELSGGIFQIQKNIELISHKLGMDGDVINEETSQQTDARIIQGESRNKSSDLLIGTIGYNIGDLSKLSAIKDPIGLTSLLKSLTKYVTEITKLSTENVNLTNISDIVNQTGLLVELLSKTSELTQANISPIK